MQWKRWTCALGIALITTSAVRAGSDRYGGVWNEGTATGVFVPLKAGMTFVDLENYMAAWETYRLSDFELVPQGCPSEQTDLFASQWEEGSWKDELTVYDSLADLAAGIIAQCEQNMKLVDVEIWNSACREMPTSYVALFSDAEGCVAEPAPTVLTTVPGDFASLVASQNAASYELVDFEANDDLNPSSILGVFYAGSKHQMFGIFERSDFEDEMIAATGQRLLIDMESYRVQPTIPPITPPERRVAGLWEDTFGGHDEHEVGEVYPKFRQLLFKDASTRRLIDFEVYPNTYDRRFEETFRSYLDPFPVAWGLSVHQMGEDVGSAAAGLATRPDPSMPLAADPMTEYTPGVLASVTKFVTALGVLSFAEAADLESGPGADWLATPVVDLLPPDDFKDFGPGVDQIKVRDFLQQRTGLSNFAPTSNAVTDPDGYRNNLIAWLQMPVALAMTAPNNLPFNYQNAHFDLLALLMNEVVLAPYYTSSNDAWREWIHDTVFDPAGIGTRFCGFSPGDARSYPLHWSTEHQTWMDQNYPCSGYGTGAAMFFLSPDDMARLARGVREYTFFSDRYSDEILLQGAGMDQFNGTTTYAPFGDPAPNTRGETFHTKNGGLGDWVNGALVATETRVVFYDDANFDDDLGNVSEYSYEKGHTDFDVGIAIHASPLDSFDPCWSPRMLCTPQRYFPDSIVMIREAFRKPEAW